ncbi:GNAT family N-acetyltransferase [Herbiconiux sp. SYSU D00978]|uniref:GNAT family N-acetyltransferase n=1 Tax=Herbiconiux sp. SYSU D00978 TaxID=2812562 RepID=UPI001A956848|nr:GNAT family N-acetyltransferase [Herbiconiux sp. SYSU D00978]
MPSPFAEKTTLRTERLTLEPLGPQHAEGTWLMLQDEEAMRLTGTTAAFTRDSVDRWLEKLAAAGDRADWAIVRSADGEHLGEIVLNEYDELASSVNFRIGMRTDVAGRGYGTEATRAVVAHAFDVLGLHRISLDVFSFNPRAQRVYEKCGFVVEGRQRETFRLPDGTWGDSVLMGILATDPR